MKSSGLKPALIGSRESVTEHSDSASLVDQAVVFQLVTGCMYGDESTNPVTISVPVVRLVSGARI